MRCRWRVQRGTRLLTYETHRLPLTQAGAGWALAPGEEPLMRRTLGPGMPLLGFLEEMHAVQVRQDGVGDDEVHPFRGKEGQRLAGIGGGERFVAPRHAARRSA